MKYSEMTPAQKKTADRIRKAYPTDERVSRVNEKRLAVAGVIAIFYVIVRIIYVGFHDGLAVPELVLLFLMVLAMWGVDLQNDVHELPRFFGKQLDPAPSARGKRFLIYLGASALLAGTWAAADYFTGLTGWDSRLAGTAIDFGITFAVCFLLTAFAGERKVRSYNRLMQQMQDEENDLS